MEATDLAQQGTYYIASMCTYFSANTSPSYVVGIAYHKLGGRHIHVTASARIPNNTALIITLYRSYYPNATVNIVGAGRENIKIVISALDGYALYFSSNVVHNHVPYAGDRKDAVNTMAVNEFSKEANVICSSQASPIDISVFYTGKY